MITCSFIFETCTTPRLFGVDQEYEQNVKDNGKDSPPIAMNYHPRLWVLGQ